MPRAQAAKVAEGCVKWEELGGGEAVEVVRASLPLYLVHAGEPWMAKADLTPAVRWCAALRLSFDPQERLAYILMDVFGHALEDCVPVCYPSWKGYLRVARAMEVAGVRSGVVRDGDEWDVVQGSCPEVTVLVNPNAKGVGVAREVVGAWILFKDPDGFECAEIVEGVDLRDAIKRSADARARRGRVGYPSSAYYDHPEAMAKRLVLRKALGRMLEGRELEGAAKALAAMWIEQETRQPSQEARSSDVPAARMRSLSSVTGLLAVEDDVAAQLLQSMGGAGGE